MYFSRASLYNVSRASAKQVIINQASLHQGIIMKFFMFTLFLFLLLVRSNHGAREEDMRTVSNFWQFLGPVGPVGPVATAPGSVISYVKEISMLDKNWNWKFENYKILVQLIYSGFLGKLWFYFPKLNLENLKFEFRNFHQMDYFSKYYNKLAHEIWKWM